MSAAPDRFAKSPQSVSKPKSTPDPMNVPDPDPNQTNPSATPPAQALKPTRPAAKPATPASAPAPAEIVSPSEEEESLDPGLDSDSKGRRQQPIPPPSEPKQYRAIGLVLGRYEASEEQFNRGLIRTDDGVEIEAVLLGRVTSLVKKHLDPTQEHLWVVYPRTREKEENLHLQIVGVWEPENLQKDEEAEAEEAASKLQAPQPRKNYFSIRGEVISYEPETHKLTVKILQMPRRKTDTIKAFRLNLVGELPGSRTVGHFWDLHAQREGEDLLIQRAQRIAMIPPRKPKKKRPGGFSGGARRKPQGGSAYPAASAAPSRPAPPRPVARQNRPTTEAPPLDDV